MGFVKFLHVIFSFENCLFKETININEDGKMIGLNMCGFFKVYWGWDVRVFSYKDISRQLFQVCG